MDIVLASASPRRQELLAQVGVSFTVVPSGVSEEVSAPMSPAALVEHLAVMKARDVAARHPGALVIGADTIVVVNGAVLGKPRDRADAIAMVERLAGRDHEVFTGVVVIGQGMEQVAHERTLVRFRSLTRTQVERYVDSGEPMDKAGSYAIQGRAAAFIESIQGDYFNVVGLPLSRTVQLLSHFGVNVL